MLAGAWLNSICTLEVCQCNSVLQSVLGVSFHRVSSSVVAVSFSTVEYFWCSGSRDLYLIESFVLLNCCD